MQIVGVLFIFFLSMGQAWAQKKCKPMIPNGISIPTAVQGATGYQDATKKIAMTASCIELKNNMNETMVEFRAAGMTPQKIASNGFYIEISASGAVSRIYYVFDKQVIQYNLVASSRDQIDEMEAAMSEVVQIKK